MPQYQYPGVYVEEVDTNVHPILGVSTPIDPTRLRSLVAVLREFEIPPWSDANEADPGVIPIELFTWLSEQLSYRADTIPECGRAAVLHAIETLAAIGEPCIKEGKPLQRPRFFPGQLLDAATLQQEQDYHREKLRRHNRALHGFGIVDGLGVRADSTSDKYAARLVVERGYAIDGCGDEIALPHGAVLGAPKSGTECYVTLRLREHPCYEESTPSASRCIEEACIVGLTTELSPPAIALAKLTRRDASWSVDPTFSPPRARSTTG